MNIIDHAKEIADLIKKYNDVELYRKIVELEGEILELSRNKLALEKLLEDLKSKLDLKEALHFKEPFYYKAGDEVPFCPKCWESDMRAIHLSRSPSNRGGTRYDCPVCKFNQLPPLK